jgi:hypothetical protein
MNRRHRWLLAFSTFLLLPGALAAQRGGGRNPNRPPPPQGGALPPDRRIGQILQQRLLLTEAQIPRIQETARHFQDRRQALGSEEMQTRQSMREMICSGDTTRGPDMSRLLDQWYDIAKRRLQMQEDEQKELSAFLTPYQRAKYIGFEEQVARQMDGRGGRGGMQPPPDGMQRGRAGRAGRMGPPPDGGGPPPDGQPPRLRPGQMPPPDACGPPPGGTLTPLRF